MKRTIYAIVALMIIFLISTASMSYAGGIGRYSGSYMFDSECIDSAAAIYNETDSLVGTNLAPIFYFDNPAGATISGVAECYIYSMDTTVCDGSGDASTPDTAAASSAGDTLYLIFATAWNSVLTGNATGYARAGEDIIDTVIFTSMTLGTDGIQTVGFTIPSTEPIGDVVYGRLKLAYYPPNATDTVDIVYNVGVSMTAR